MPTFRKYNILLVLVLLVCVHLGKCETEVEDKNGNEQDKSIKETVKEEEKQAKKGSGVLNSYLAGLGSETLQNTAGKVRIPPVTITRAPPPVPINNGIRRRPRPTYTPRPVYSEGPYNPEPSYSRPAPPQPPQRRPRPTPQIQKTTLPPFKTEEHRQAYEFLQLLEKQQAQQAAVAAAAPPTPPPTTTPKPTLHPIAFEIATTLDYDDYENGESVKNTPATPAPRPTPPPPPPPPPPQRRRRTTTIAPFSAPVINGQFQNNAYYPAPQNPPHLPQQGPPPPPPPNPPQQSGPAPPPPPPPLPQQQQPNYNPYQHYQQPQQGYYPQPPSQQHPPYPQQPGYPAPIPPQYQPQQNYPPPYQQQAGYPQQPLPPLHQQQQSPSQAFPQHPPLPPHQPQPGYYPPHQTQQQSPQYPQYSFPPQPPQNQQQQSYPQQPLPQQLPQFQPQQQTQFPPNPNPPLPPHLPPYTHQIATTLPPGPEDYDYIDSVAPQTTTTAPVVPPQLPPAPVLAPTSALAPVNPPGILEQTPSPALLAALGNYDPQALKRLQTLIALQKLQQIHNATGNGTTTENPYIIKPGQLVFNPYYAPTKLTTTTDNPDDAIQDLSNLFGSLAVGNLAGVVDGTLKFAGTGVFNNLNSWVACQRGSCDGSGGAEANTPANKAPPSHPAGANSNIPHPPQHRYPGQRSSE